MLAILRDYVARMDPVVVSVSATLSVIVGALVILVPAILVWVVGLAGVLFGVALLATLLTQDRR